MVIAAYGRSVHEPGDVLSHMDFMPPDGHVTSSIGRPPSQAIFPTDAIMTQFQHKLARYLKGAGHPTHDLLTEEFVTSEERVKHESDVSMRARRFLRFATGSELMPHGNWRLTVSTINVL